MASQPNRPQVNELYGTRFVKLYDLAYDDGSHYFEASRREARDLLATKDEHELVCELPDAVSACLVVITPDDEPRMVLNYEYRYPTGQYVLGIPSGLIDARDVDTDDPLVSSMTREIAEETGVRLREDDRMARLDDLSSLSHAGAEGSERFGAFELLSKDEVRHILKTGRDPKGHFYPMVAWAAMTYFACDLWKEGLS